MYNPKGVVWVIGKVGGNIIMETSNQKPLDYWGKARDLLVNRAKAKVVCSVMATEEL